MGLCKFTRFFANVQLYICVLAKRHADVNMECGIIPRSLGTLGALRTLESLGTLGTLRTLRTLRSLGSYADARCSTWRRVYL